MTLNLYYATGSCSMVAHWCLAEARADYTLTLVDFSQNQQKASDYLRLSPIGQVPVLVADGRTITELAAVLTYIAARFPEVRLIPFDNVVKLAETYEWLSWLSTTGHRAIAQIFRTERFARDPSVFEQIVESGRVTIGEVLAQIDERLVGRVFALGDSFSVVDPFLFVFQNWSLRLGFAPERWPHLFAHAERLMERPAANQVFGREQWMPLIATVRATAADAGLQPTPFAS